VETLITKYFSILTGLKKLKYLIIFESALNPVPSLLIKNIFTLKLVIEESSPAVSPISFATVVITGSVSPVSSLVGVLEVSSVVVRINEHPVRVVCHKSKNVQPSINVDVLQSVLDTPCWRGSGCGRRNGTRDGGKNCRRLSCRTDGCRDRRPKGSRQRVEPGRGTVRKASRNPVSGSRTLEQRERRCRATVCCCLACQCCRRKSRCCSIHGHDRIRRQRGEGRIRRNRRGNRSRRRRRSGKRRRQRGLSGCHRLDGRGRCGETAFPHFLFPAPLRIHNSYNNKRQNVKSLHFQNEGPTQLNKLGLGEARPCKIEKFYSKIFEFSPMKNCMTIKRVTSL
jgi:hypothetical protein